MTSIFCKNQTFTGIKAIIFDKDGTLENSQPFLRELLLKRIRLLDSQVPGVGEPLLMAFGLQNNLLDPTGLMAVGSRQENEIAAAAYLAETGKGWFESLEMVKKVFKEADECIPKNMINSPIFPDVKPVIEALATSEIKLGVLSSDSTENVEEFLEKYQLSPYFTLKMGLHSQWFKPNPQLLIYACQHLNVSPNNTLMIGDALGDILMAKEAKAAAAIAISRDNLSSTCLREADIIINSLDQIQLHP